MKMFPDAAADAPSGSSLSFAGFVSERDKDSGPQIQHVQPPDNDQKASQEFEFSAAIPKRWSLAGSSNGQLQHQRGKQYSSEAVVVPGQSNNGRSLVTESCLERSTGKPNNGVKNGTDKKLSTNSGFGHKIFNSFACRDCRAIEPSPTHSVVERATQ